MIAAVTAIAAFPLGLLLRSRAHANTTYAIAYLWAFTFQTLYLVLPGFQGPSPDTPFPVGEFPLTYGLVAASSVLAVGVGAGGGGTPHRCASSGPPGLLGARDIAGRHPDVTSGTGL